MGAVFSDRLCCEFFHIDRTFNLSRTRNGKSFSTIENRHELCELWGGEIGLGPTRLALWVVVMGTSTLCDGYNVLFTVQNDSHMSVGA